jgi:hypothetical protein
MITYSRGPLRLAQLWFDESLESKGVDIVTYLQREEPISGGTSLPKHTIIVDLTLETAVLLANIKKDTRYDIRRAETRDGLRYKICREPSAEALSAFCCFYNAFADHKRLHRVSELELSRMRTQRGLQLSTVLDAQGQPLVWHSYGCVRGRARLLQSASHFRLAASSETRNLLARANRYLHWRDMLHFKAEGYHTYDLGGWYCGSSDRELLQINKFKEEFGGRVVLNYNCEVGLTLVGKAALRLRPVLRTLLSKATMR